VEVILIKPIQVEAAFIGLGFAYCFHGILFRWGVLRDKYGSSGLLRWAGKALFTTSMLGWLAAWAVWLVERQLSN
jgi:hypothetical protein